MYHLPAPGGPRGPWNRGPGGIEWASGPCSFLSLDPSCMPGGNFGRSSRDDTAFAPEDEPSLSFLSAEELLSRREEGWDRDSRPPKELLQ